MTTDGTAVPMSPVALHVQVDTHHDADTDYDAQYAVMILDIRGSTKQLSSPNVGPREAARRVRTMLDSVNDILGNDEPTFLKSTGDGFFCVWKLNELSLHGEQLRVLKAAHRIYSQLPNQLRREPGVSGEIGIGLTFGTLAHFDNGPINDYFGYFANLAAKLQDAARPHGLVVDAAPLTRWPDDLRQNLPALDLKYHEVSPSSPLNEFRVKACYATRSVELAHNWTCLAWPGFATAQQDLNHGNDRLSFGLNTRGITVITHEGLQGKIGTLAISRAFEASSRGEHFQIYIDDYDALDMLHHQGQVSFLAAEDPSGAVKVNLSRDLYSTCSSCGFTFIPVRCGINGLAANSGFPWPLGDFATYNALLDQIEKASEDDLSLDEIALYENVGATLPILVMAANPSLTYKNVLKDADDQALQTTRDRLLSLVGKKGMRFSRYSKIEHLASDLGTGAIKLVIGGGAWLAAPGLSLPEQLLFSVPATSGALLWIEGAALHSAAKDAQALLRFLSQSVLSEEFQDRVHFVQPYPAFPCTYKAIGKILSGEIHNESLGYDVAKETKLAFQSKHKLQKNISIRHAPAKNPEVWTEVFTEIMQGCCDSRSLDLI